MLRTLCKTTSREEADFVEKTLTKKYGMWAIYRFQYWSNDGNFYYEILLREDDEQ